ncbi:MAG: CPBP family intramembrane glutamic endopeptidase [Terriglobales bacterium]|jgi:membrane protease YdiL (CAAX protease family)
MGKMEVESKTYLAKTSASSSARAGESFVISTGYLRYFIWAQIIIVFVLLELAIWAPTRTTRNRWAVIAAITILVFSLINVLMHQTSLKRLGLGLPKLRGAIVVLGIGFATAFFLLILVKWMGGDIPASPTWWPNLQSTWGYAIWALLQEFILQSFFFNRCEELYGSSAAVWIAATLFAAVHLPSPVLTTATLIGALFFCEMFRHYRSIYPLAIVHAMLGVTIALTVPDSLLHHMRVGIGYLRY